MNLEERYGEFNGLNLTHAVLLGINKYPYLLNKDKGLYDTEWEQIKKIRKEWNIPDNKPTLEAQLMDISDDIAYSTHDIEDGMKAGKIILNKDFLETEWLNEALIKQVEKIKPKNPELWLEISSTEDEIKKVMNSYLETWEAIKKKFNDESIARQELKGHYVNLFASRVGLIEDEDWYKVSFVDKESPENEDKALWRQMIILKKLANLSGKPPLYISNLISSKLKQLPSGKSKVNVRKLQTQKNSYFIRVGNIMASA